MVDLKKLINSFWFAFEGIFFALSRDQNLRIHLIIAVVVIIASFLLEMTFIEKGILFLTVIIVLVTEMMNSAVEQVVDLIINEHRKEAKFAKDVAAGMVLVAAVGSVIVGIFLFTPYILKMFTP